MDLTLPAGVVVPDVTLLPGCERYASRLPLNAHCSRWCLCVTRCDLHDLRLITLPHGLPTATATWRLVGTLLQTVDSRYGCVVTTLRFRYPFRVLPCSVWTVDPAGAGRCYGPVLPAFVHVTDYVVVDLLRFYGWTGVYRLRLFPCRLLVGFTLRYPVYG